MILAWHVQIDHTKLLIKYDLVTFFTSHSTVRKQLGAGTNSRIFHQHKKEDKEKAARHEHQVIRQIPWNVWRAKAFKPNDT